MSDGWFLDNTHTMHDLQLQGNASCCNSYQLHYHLVTLFKGQPQEVWQRIQKDIQNTTYAVVDEGSF